jgi:hypothetical protein
MHNGAGKISRNARKFRSISEARIQGTVARTACPTNLLWDCDFPNAGLPIEHFVSHSVKDEVVIT